ncbi:hypothetical protein PtA15_3A337 [Puccinia triticina]|uniref:Uncharacterized protein n=1 Tax=Puccinia triticina TaxID=208348 RepID=A0ABY7CCM1_9BASI|nr:uncharacterized protein PtA15_3A337 [Puccinia triticina]WAQ82971.1 hypothetical protein PtA15_3A337 [Puccinia triticina]
MNRLTHLMNRLTHLMNRLTHLMNGLIHTMNHPINPKLMGCLSHGPTGPESSDGPREWVKNEDISFCGSTFSSFGRLPIASNRGLDIETAAIDVADDWRLRRFRVDDMKVQGPAAFAELRLDPGLAAPSR